MRSDEYRPTRSANAELFPSDVFKRGAQHIPVVMGQVGDHRALGVQGVGGVKPTAKADFGQEYRGRALCCQHDRQGKAALEPRHRLARTAAAT